jgi:hypothetical protein
VHKYVAVNLRLYPRETEKILGIKDDEIRHIGRPRLVNPSGLIQVRIYVISDLIRNGLERWNTSDKSN